MDRVLTNSQMRAADEYTVKVAGVPSGTLMRRAGIAIFEEVAGLDGADRAEILVVCGNGNNGGDGYVCAQELLRRNYNVKVYCFGGDISPDCARERAAYTGEYADVIRGGIIVDCIFGTELTRKVSGVYAEAVDSINASGAFVVSADIPSGLNGDNGLVLGCAVRADLTVAIAEYKAGFFLGDGPDYCGKIVRCDIGIACPPAGYISVYNDADVKTFYPARRRNSHKGSYGSANLIAGSERYTGAAALAVDAALRSGCGYVKLTSPESVKRALACRYAQAIYLERYDPQSQAIAAGMGCGATQELYSTLKSLLTEYGGTLIIDADGLNALAKYGVDILKRKSCAVILTPHVKEFSRLTGIAVSDILNDPVKYAAEFAKEYGVTLLLKGAASVITDGERIVFNVRGSTALAKGGSGDMLSGYMCGCAARGLEPFDAAVCAAYTLGLSAEISSAQKTDYCATARDILKNLHLGVKRLTE